MSKTNERNAVMLEFWKGGGGRVWDSEAMADKIVRLRDKLAAVEAERDDLEREAHDQACALHTALLGRICEESGSESACHPMICDCFSPYKDMTFPEMCKRVAKNQRILAALREPSEGMQKAAIDEYWCPFMGGRKVWIRVIRAAVKTAEQEVGRE